MLPKNLQARRINHPQSLAITPQFLLTATALSSPHTTHSEDHDDHTSVGSNDHAASLRSEDHIMHTISSTATHEKEAIISNMLPVVRSTQSL